MVHEVKPDHQLRVLYGQSQEEKKTLFVLKIHYCRKELMINIFLHFDQNKKFLWYQLLIKKNDTKEWHFNPSQVIFKYQWNIRIL